jgi:hypothetical protein
MPMKPVSMRSRTSKNGTAAGQATGRRNPGPAGTAANRAQKRGSTRGYGRTKAVGNNSATGRRS